MDSIVVWGAGGHAKVVAQSIRRLDRWVIAGFIDDVEPDRAGEAFGGARVLGGREVLPALRKQGIEHMILGFGQVDARLALAADLCRQGWNFASIVDLTASLADDVVLGDGSYVAAGAVVQPGVVIGSHAIVNTGATVDHDCNVGEGVHICPRACLAGHVVVGRASWIGAGAVVRDRVCVGARAVVGAGSLVLDDVTDGWICYGHPAKPIRRVSD